MTDRNDDPDKAGDERRAKLVKAGVAVGIGSAAIVASPFTVMVGGCGAGFCCASALDARNSTAVDTTTASFIGILAGEIKESARRTSSARAPRA